MITVDSMMAIEKADLPEASKALGKDDIMLLVKRVSLSDNSIRYQTFLLLQYRSAFFDDVYPYWDVFAANLKGDNSYQRSIGLMLLAENARWDTENKMEAVLDDFLGFLHDEKPITIRQCIQSLGKIAASKPDLAGKIADALMAVDILSVKETMRKLILTDILDVLFNIRKERKTDTAENYILNTLSGGILDKKSKARFEALL